MPDTIKYLSIFNVGGIDYNLKDAAATEKLSTLLGNHTVVELGAAAWQALAADISDGNGAIADAATVKAYVDAQVGAIHNFDVVIDADGTEAGPSVEASKDTMYKIYLVPDTNAEAGSYIEWITIKSGESFSWEAIGSTKTSLDGYVEKTQKIANLTLNKDISVAELQAALELKAFAYASKGTATVASKTVSGVKAAGTSAGALSGALAVTPTDVSSTGSFKAVGSITGSAISGGSIDVTLKDAEAASAATVTATAYKPFGTVETKFTAADESAVDAISFGGSVSKPNTTVTPATTAIKGMKTAGTAYSITDGSVTKGEDTKSDFATEGVVASVSGETLTFTAAGTNKAVTAAGAVNYTAPVLSGALPTFEEAADVMTSVAVDVSQPSFTPNKYVVNSEFSGTEEANMKVTGVTYKKQVVDTKSFTPIGATLGFSGDTQTVSVSGKYDKTTIGTLAFEGKDIELAVGNIVVPEQVIDVTPVAE